MKKQIEQILQLTSSSLAQSVLSIAQTTTERNSLVFEQLPSTFPSRGQSSKRSKQLEDQKRWGKQPCIFKINVSKVEQSFKISSEFKLNEGMTLSLLF